MTPRRSRVIRVFLAVVSFGAVLGAISLTNLSVRKAEAHSTSRPAPAIQFLSTSTVARSGYVVVNGANFDRTGSDLAVTIDGVKAPFARRPNGELVVYMPDAVPLGVRTLKVANADGERTAAIQVADRPAQVGRIRWRFPVASSYASHRPVIAPNGTIYLYDVGGNLYSISPAGVLNWVFNVSQAGGFYQLGPPALGLDGTIYVPASLPSGGVFPGGIVAVNPDGTLKWAFAQPPGTGGRAIISGPGVGPDGNVYAVVDRGGLQLFSLTPAGNLRWTDGQFSDLGPLGFEISFDAENGQLYLQSDLWGVEPAGKIFAYDFDGNRRFSSVTTTNGQTVVAPVSKNIYTPVFPTGVGNRLRAYNPDGDILWQFGGYPTTNTISAPDAGVDDAAYVVINLANLYAINPNGTQRWVYRDTGAMQDPIVNAQNNLIVVGGVITFGQQGFILGVDTNGNEKWRVELPDENGPADYGQVRPEARPRFSADGQTAYVTAEVAGVSPNTHQSYLYAIDASDNAPVVEPTVQMTNPSNGATFSPPLSNIPISASAADADGSIARVNFYLNNGFGWYYLGSDDTAPYQVPFSTPSSGTTDYDISAQSVDNDGNVSALGTPVSIHINSSGGPIPLPGAPPNILTPTNGQSFPSGSNIALSSDQGGASWTISRVEFYANGVLLGSDTGFPYEFTWVGAPEGTHSLVARAISPTRQPANSAPVSVTVMPAPGNAAPDVNLTSPANGAHYQSPSAIPVSANAFDTDGSITEVQFFANGTLIGTANSAPYQIQWAGMASGRNYQIMARAVDNQGAERASAPVTVVVGGKSTFDFDGDGRSDLGVFRPSDTYWYIRQSQGGNLSVQFGVASDRIVPADYDGDGKTDIAVYRTGTWYLQRSTAGFTGVPFGLADDIPQPADFDGDGKAELAVFRPSDGTWYLLNLATNQFSAVQFGTNGDRPVVGDYDGDRKADHAVYRPADGRWYVLGSTNGFTSTQFGATSDRPVPADYDADGKTDPAVYRDGNWYLLRSTAGFTSLSFGLGTDVPAPADYDGDGKADPTVYRDGTWYLLGSTSGFQGVAFGDAGDRPASAAFVP